jgi:hypothetical protein
MRQSGWMSTEPEADRGPRAGSPRGVVVATGSCNRKVVARNADPVATASGSVFVWMVNGTPNLSTRRRTVGGGIQTGFPYR